MTIQFAADLRQAVFQAISVVNLSDDRVIAFGWNEASSRILKLLITEQIVDENELLADIHLRLLQLGRRSFNQHKNSGIYPDRTYSPHALAYALCAGALTTEEKAGIRYEQGETEEHFTNVYNATDLRKRVLSELLFERP